MWEANGKGLTLYDGLEGGSNFDGRRQQVVTGGMVLKRCGKAAGMD